MNTYSIYYSLLACGLTHIDASSKEKAIKNFEKMVKESSFNDLFDGKEMMRRIEIDEIQKL